MTNSERRGSKTEYWSASSDNSCAVERKRMSGPGKGGAGGFIGFTSENRETLRILC